jgi:hypothetical protein
MPVDEVDKQIDQMLCQDSGATSPGSCEDEWQPLKPTFSSAEHERIAEAFFGPDAETLTGEEALSRRTKVIGDLVTLCDLQGTPSSRKEATVVVVRGHRRHRLEGGREPSREPGSGYKKKTGKYRANWHDIEEDRSLGY